MPTLLLTRPEADAEALAAALADLGVDSLVAPMMDVVHIPGPPLELDNVSGLLLTSANGVRALAARTDIRDIPVFAVGDATAKAAKTAGFVSVTSAGGDVDDLAEVVANACVPGNGVLLHAAGSVTAGDLAGRLEYIGYQVWREMLYEARPRDVMPKAVRSAIADGRIDGVVLYSPRTARIFDRLVDAAGLRKNVSDMVLFALSANVDMASAGPWAERHISAAPKQEALLHTIRSCYY